MSRVIRLLLSCFVFCLHTKGGFCDEKKMWLAGGDGLVDFSSIPLINDHVNGVAICFNPSYDAFIKVVSNKYGYVKSKRIQSTAVVYRRQKDSFQKVCKLSLPFEYIPQVTILSSDARYVVCLNEHPVGGGGFPPNCVIYIADTQTQKSISYKLNELIAEEQIHRDRGQLEQGTFLESSRIQKTRVRRAGMIWFLQWFSSIDVDYANFIVKIGGGHIQDVPNGKVYSFKEIRVSPKRMKVDILSESDEK